MEDKVKSINVLLAAFEARNALLYEEIEQNTQAIRDMRTELVTILETNTIPQEEETMKMVI